jgi:hypothetical protein
MLLRVFITGRIGDVVFHAIGPDCVRQLYPGLAEEILSATEGPKPGPVR